LLVLDHLYAGYGAMEVLRDVSLRLAGGTSLCLVGPNGAGKSTVLNAIFGFARIFSGTVTLSGRDIAKLPASDKLKTARLAYVLQRGSVFPDMTVEENLLMGGYLLDHPSEARDAAERVLERYPKLQARRRERANVLSGGERRLLEISRALIMDPKVVLIDEPSIGLEPRAIDMIFDTLRELRDEAGKTLVLVEQNARKGLEFADIGYVLVAGRVVKAGPGKELLGDPEMGRLFLGG
jgi:branched-chain amino acid transport system ATP-binding protein